MCEGCSPQCFCERRSDLRTVITTLTFRTGIARKILYAQQMRNIMIRNGGDRFSYIAKMILASYRVFSTYSSYKNHPAHPYTLRAEQVGYIRERFIVGGILKGVFSGG
jgi:hypothetical protein